MTVELRLQTLENASARQKSVEDIRTVVSTMRKLPDQGNFADLGRYITEDCSYTTSGAQKVLDGKEMDDRDAEAITSGAQDRIDNDIQGCWHMFGTIDVDLAEDGLEATAQAYLLETISQPGNVGPELMLLGGWSDFKLRKFGETWKVYSANLTIKFQGSAPGDWSWNNIA